MAAMRETGRTELQMNTDEFGALIRAIHIHL